METTKYRGQFPAAIQPDPDSAVDGHAWKGLDQASPAASGLAHNVESIQYRSTLKGNVEYSVARLDIVEFHEVETDGVLGATRLEHIKLQILFPKVGGTEYPRSIRARDSIGFLALVGEHVRNVLVLGDPFAESARHVVLPGVGYPQLPPGVGAKSWSAQVHCDLFDR